MQQHNIHWILDDIPSKRRIVTIISTANDIYNNDEELIRSSLRILSKLKIPEDIVSMNLVLNINVRSQ